MSTSDSASGGLDPVRAAGLDALANELYDLQCELYLAALGEHLYTAEQVEAMRRRVAELEPLAGDHLHQLLGIDESAAGTEPGDPTR